MILVKIKDILQNIRCNNITMEYSFGIKPKHFFSCIFVLFIEFREAKVLTEYYVTNRRTGNKGFDCIM